MVCEGVGEEVVTSTEAFACLNKHVVLAAPEGCRSSLTEGSRLGMPEMSSLEGHSSNKRIRGGSERGARGARYGVPARVTGET